MGCKPLSFVGLFVCLFACLFVGLFWTPLGCIQRMSIKIIDIGKRCLPKNGQ